MSTESKTMRAVVVESPGGPDVLTIHELPIPNPSPGWVLIRVEAFGLNRSELHFRRGMADFGSFPRVPGIEATGTVVDCPGGEVTPGTRVATLMGGMGRIFDGGYAEYTCVPVSNVIAFDSDLPWSILGAIPEMLQTAYGSLTVGVDGRAGQTLLIRGGTSSVGLALAVLARRAGLRVIATTRNPGRQDFLGEFADHVVVDDGDIADAVRALAHGGVDGAVELVGANTLRDTLRCTRIRGVVCFTGMLSDQWTIHDFYPIDYLPTGVRLTAYTGGAADLPQSVLQGFLDDVAGGRAIVPIGKTYTLDEIVQAHSDMESGALTGKGVVVTR